jgi:hypothetical protein
MSGSATKQMLPVYVQMAAPTRFLSGLFQSPPRNFYNSETVEIDIVRGDEDVSVVITDLSTGYRFNETDIYTNKEFAPPINKEAIAINSYDLLKRMAGENPYQDPGFRANVISRFMMGMPKIEDKIRRTIELQASQVLQTGVITLVDINGTTLYTIDFKPKTAHFPNAGTAWDQAAADPLGDIDALAQIIRSNGLVTCDQIIMGNGSWNEFKKNSIVQSQLNIINMNIGQVVRPTTNGEGGTYQMTVSIGNYNYEVWTYDGRYNHPQTDVKTKYIADDKVVVRAKSGRLDATFGAIPNIGKLLGANQSNLFPELPGRFSNAAGGMDLFTNIWLSQDGEQLFGGIGARPLMIPTAIDTYGCIDTGI